MHDHIIQQILTIRNPDPNARKQFDIALSNYNNGISKEEYAIFCNSSNLSSKTNSVISSVNLFHFFLLNS